ncbi:hypothetical protein BDZ45DRAFT_746444 [Acephala macrosclerotiorum]|nr:hypothetical protein BDZ45DRAFT_746444 [Acephala macrosclerotiorum]
MRDLYNTPAMANFVESVRALLYREYWYRIWILPELVFTKKVTIACGRKRISLNAFELMSFDLSRAGMIENLSMSPTLAPALHMLKERKRRQRSNEQRKLADLLTFAHILGAADTRLRTSKHKDRVYALLELATDADALGTVTDYAESDEKTAGPPWVPDWWLELDESPNYCGFSDRSFHASGQLQRHLHSSNDEDSSILAISGTKVDTIIFAGAIFYQEDTTRKDIPIPWDSVQFFLSQIENYCHYSCRMVPSVYGDPYQWFEQVLYRIPQKYGQHELVGDAYVYDIMDGEFMEKNPELETFSLV